jgi:hypothetical protein
MKHEVHDDPHSEQVTNGRYSTSQQFSSTKTTATVGCRMKRKRPGPVNRRGNSSRNCLENTHTRPVSMVSKIPNGNAMAITRNFSTGTIVSRRNITLLTLESASPCPSLATAFCLYLPTGAGYLPECGLSAHFQDSLGIEGAAKLDEFGNKSSPAGLVTGALLHCHGLIRT